MSEQVMEMMSLLRQINMRLHHCLKELYEPLGLTGPQAVVMIELFKEDGQRICDLAEAAGMTVSNISAICQRSYFCQRLERNGFLHRVRSQQDQRTVRICLSEKSLQLIRDCDHQIALQSDQISLKMTAEELDEINSGLRKLNEFLDREDL